MGFRLLQARLTHAPPPPLLPPSPPSPPPHTPSPSDVRDLNPRSTAQIQQLLFAPCRSDTLTPLSPLHLSPLT